MESICRVQRVCPFYKFHKQFGERKVAVCTCHKQLWRQFLCTRRKQHLEGAFWICPPRAGCEPLAPYFFPTTLHTGLLRLTQATPRVDTT